MADQKITELPIKNVSGIQSADYLLGIDSAEGYQMLISSIGEYILDRLALTHDTSAGTANSVLDKLAGIATSISSINSALGDLAYEGGTFSFDSTRIQNVSGCKLAKLGKLVVFSVNSAVTGTINSGSAGAGFISFPSGFRPDVATTFQGNNGSASQMNFYVTTGGQFQVLGSNIASGAYVRLSGAFWTA